MSESQYTQPNQPYQQGPYPGGGYGPAAPPAYGYDPRAAEANNAATLALVLGILSVVVLPILGPFAVWQAGKAEKLGKSATAGKIFGWIGVAFLIIGALVVLLMIMGAVAGLSGY